MSLHPFKRRSDGPPADPYEAADWWAAKRALGTLSGRDKATFERWVEVPENRVAYDLVARVHEQAAAYAAEPEILQMRQQALNAHVPSSPLWSWRGVAATAVVGVLIAGGTGWLAWRSASTDGGAVVADASEASLPTTKRYETKVGERRQVRLDDGSVVSLNTGSALEVAYNSQRRDVRLLRGQALFQVAHNKAWPFVVKAGDRQVTAVGTSFDVRVDGPRVKVVLVEGKVRVDPIQREGLGKLIPQLMEEDLAPGQQLVASQGKVLMATADVARTTSWTTGQLIFWDDSLGSAVAELNRYSERQIVISDPKIAALKVSGVFRASRPEDFVTAVTTFYALMAVQTAPGFTELSWRAPR